ncbi:flavin-linked sulfhydryl oxidase [Sporobolomyces salmoneus]|uniref:flavin-linked sulfhydryl oxidase n=1 Tax=Sporobolomyces salmoneus TaxID=183962 RepID=UPI00316E0080
MTETASTTTSKPVLKPGEVLGPDGKPCKVCTGFKAWTGGATKKKSSTTAGATASGFAASSSLESSSSSSLPSDCPPDVERLGRHTWTFLHTTASYFPPSPTPHQQSSMLSLLRSLPTLYPCGDCAGHLGEYMKVNPPEQAVKTRLGVEEWMCKAHNEVNERLGKDKFECMNVGERWRDGWKDGHCD